MAFSENEYPYNFIFNTTEKCAYDTDEQTCRSIHIFEMCKTCWKKDVREKYKYKGE